MYTLNTFSTVLARRLGLKSPPIPPGATWSKINEAAESVADAVVPPDPPAAVPEEAQQARCSDVDSRLRVVEFLAS